MKEENGPVSVHREDGGGRHPEGTGRAALRSVRSQNPVSMMEHEHDSAGNALRAMREASSGYSAPAGRVASVTRRCTRRLSEFESDLHQHIHLENNILFPRAIAMEKPRNAAEIGVRLCMR